MVEIPEELKAFNINFVYAEENVKPPTFFIKKIAEEVLFDEYKERVDEELARKLAKEMVNSN